MNLRIILHLIRTDWLRLRKPVMILWLLWLLTALPWFLRDPHGFTLPFYQESGGNGDLGSPAEMALHANVWSREFLLWGNLAASVISWVLAAVIGMAGKQGRMIQPVREIEKFLALALSLALFLVLPKALLVAVHLLFQGFSTKVILLGALNHALSAGLLAGSVALFAAWCSSGWACLAGLVALASAGSLLDGVFQSRRLAFLRFAEKPWIVPTGLEVWWFGAACVILLGGLHPWFRSRFGMPVRTAVAVGLVLSAGCLADSLTSVPEIAPKPGSAMPIKVRPVVRNAWMEHGRWPLQGVAGADIQPLSLKVDLGAEGCPEGHAVEWEADGPGLVIQGGRVRAEVSNRGEMKGLKYSPSRNSGQFIPKDGGDRPWSYQAVVAALPGRSRPVGATEWDKFTNRFPVDLGELTMIPGNRIIPATSARLKGTLHGTVYRYETVADLPLGAEAARVSRGDVVWQARRFPTKKGELVADLVVSHPAIGRSSDPDEVRWDASPLGNCQFYFHLPKSGANVRLRSEFNADGPCYASAGWHRRLLRVDLNALRESVGWDAEIDFSDVRLLVLKPVVVSVLSGIQIDVPLSFDQPGQKFQDFQINHQYRVDARRYQEDMMPRRPDPKTCTREQFGRWLRASATVVQADSQPARDLACYAPRFADVMAEVARQTNVRWALTIGTPDSRRHMLLEKIATVEQPDELVRIAIERGWLDEARQSVLERSREGLLKAGMTMSLEDPSTYPALLEKLRRHPDLQLYENLRLLPGIEPGLSEAIEDSMRRADLPFLKSKARNRSNPQPFGPFVLGAKVGNAEALDAVIALLVAGGEEGATFYQTIQLGGIVAAPRFSGSINKAWLVFLRGKSAADFQYDPLARVWRPRNSNPQAP